MIRNRLNLPKDEVLDMLDETLVRLLDEIQNASKAHAFERLNRDDLGRYLATAIVNRYRDRLKHLHVIERSERELLSALEQSSTPESIVIAREQIDRLRVAIRALKLPYRQLFDRLMNEDITLAEIARKYHIKHGTIYTQFQRGLQILQAIWKLDAEGKGPG